MVFCENLHLLFAHKNVGNCDWPSDEAVFVCMVPYGVVKPTGYNCEFTELYK